MKYEDSHLSDQQLLMEIDGELSAHDEKPVRAHLEACWKCRARRQELDQAIAGFIRVHHRELDATLPPASGPHALLRAQLTQLAAHQQHQRTPWFDTRHRLSWVLAAATCGLLAIGLLLSRLNVHRQSPSHASSLIVTVPDSTLTPGATLRVSQRHVCSETNAKNKPVPVSLQRKVFEEYGIVGAEPRAYEVDYLVTPALGGADDIHNLWPHSYSATQWNARVKDALEDRLREMVCDGSLNLGTAQQEIAVNWIAAYKKYFHTDRPLAEHIQPANQ